MSRNLTLLEETAGRLAGLVDEVVFVGGCVLDLLITDPAAAPVRETIDVDIIAKISTYADYIAFSNRLRILGFTEDRGENAPLCRWRHGVVRLDVMPIDEKVLGFGNIWYRAALENAVGASLPGGRRIRAIAAPYFLGTKMEAFRGRGEGDFFSSHDLEDFVAVVEGRETIVPEVASSSPALRHYLGAAAGELLAEPRFRDALPGYLLGDLASQLRLPVVLARLSAISKMPAD